MTENSVLHQVMYQIANSTVRSYPYPHIIVDNVFPTDYYQQMLKNFPEQKFMASHSAAYKKRTILRLRELDSSDLSDEKKSFWQDFHDQFAGDEFRNFVLSLWGNSFRETYSFHTYSRIELAEDMPGYAIGPHKDSHNKMVTMLFYLAEDDSRPESGTRILIPKGEVNGSFAHGKDKKFHLAGLSEYLPNRLFAFAPNDYTYHSVDKLKSKLPRKTIQFNITHKDLGIS